MKIAAYNVENLFDRAKVFNKNSSISQKTITAVAELNALFEKDTYLSADKANMIMLIKELGMQKSDTGTYAIIRKIRGKIIKRPRSRAPIEIVAKGRKSWIGWAELKMGHVNEIAIHNTGRVLKDVDADILAVIEAEHRIALKQFSDNIIKKVGGTPYPHIMLIDGNDDRGIDVGIMTKDGYNIGLMQSHIDDLKPDGKKVFSRDCPEYCVETPNGEKIWVLPNHFKSKYGGNDPSSIAKRKAQATRTAEIYQRLIIEGYENVVVLGDFNDTPNSEPLKPLLTGTDLKDVSEHPSFDTGKFAGKGTFGLGNDNDKIDFLLLSPALFNRVTKGGLFRKGAWPGVRPEPRWEVYPELKKKIHVASDHHVIWCEIN